MEYCRVVNDRHADTDYGTTARIACKAILHRRGFTLYDLLISVFVMALLMAVLLPTLGKAYESARRVQCASNQRQVSLALHMYADNYGGVLPPSVFADDPSTQALEDQPQEMLMLRLDHHPRGGDGVVWDGLGILHELDFLSHPGVFYCPSHHSFHTYEEYKDEFKEYQGSIAGNMQYRYDNRAQRQYLSDMPSETALLADGLRSRPDNNHEVGMNAARADGSVQWLEDQGRRLYNAMPYSESSPSARMIVKRIWGSLDRGSIADFADIVP